MNEIKSSGEQAPTFEEAYRRLEEISRRLEDSSTPLELSFKLYEEGQTLINLCQKMLEPRRTISPLSVYATEYPRPKTAFGDSADTRPATASM